MINRYKLIRKLNKEIKDLEYKIENRGKYNISIFPKALMIKSGIYLEKTLPYFLSAGICMGMFHYFDKKPFKLEKIKESASIQHLITSTGYEKKNISYEKDYSDNKIIYTTGWHKNEYGLYERTQITYNLSDIRSVDDILNMTQEELSEFFSITNIEKIQKRVLDNDDSLYSEDMLIIKEVITDDEYAYVRNETSSENLFQTALYTLFVLGLGLFITKIKHVIIKKDISNKFYYMEVKYKFITKHDLKILNQRLKVKKQNLKLLEDLGEENAKKYV